METIDQIRLKPATMSLLSQKWVDWLNDIEVVRFSNQRNQMHTLDSQREFLTRKLNDPSSKLFGIFFARAHIGMVELGNINPERDSAEVRYLIGEKTLWGKGIASFVVKKMVEMSRELQTIKLLEAGADTRNTGSIKVLLKNGFQPAHEKDDIQWFRKVI
ncbi:GNAT family N-acetyltransferase [Thalassospira lucentensis]|uniref:GNAT family N-acetyltransferase n=1 Tax=Thalassospira lucentensis TaxID=168935 RepID=UPI0003B435AD|nr:GNAT family N-acetyltransferase [Thalassospira lucentensis]RCK30575.1 hypothetical protein TH1_01215 [Thalassospira lucentensis MCCC 1A00383 = DSM 14000]|tara:strand:+ start:25203 stop:25682 length:480 start_codon:yes stop_codon:yes gene_type:complete